MSKSVSEIRFAVVMYGGLSLAIYINGVAQELLKMTRSTNKDSNFDSTEAVYRKIACLLGDDEILEKIKGGETSEDIKKLLSELDEKACSPTKFVVDILSGTSAGGINAVFLAKALVNDQNIDQLQKLWLNEGEIAKLINDKKSVADTKLKNADSTKSFFNSQRMYLKLLDALEGMEKTKGDPLVKNLDLFVTVTDFAGVTVPLRLSDKLVEEKRYKQVLNFRYEKGFNDFQSKNNPMLAFAARCTSAFPFAFEPMRFKSASEVIDLSYADATQKNKNLQADIKRFFPLIKDAQGNEIKWDKRDLVDGGVLDNKPFGHAIKTIADRNAEVNIRRKLLYVEPSPETFDFAPEDSPPPDAISNLKACAFDLPTYETIREDLEKVLERNRLIERVNRFISSAEQDVFNYRLAIESQISNDKKGGHDSSSEKMSLPENGLDWEKMGLEDVVRWKGNAALPYYRLRIATLTDDLGRIIARKLGIPEDGEHYKIIRVLAQAWRNKNYGYYRKETSETESRDKTVLYFLREFDINYRLRRFRFVLNKADQLYRFTESFQKELATRQKQVAKISKQQDSSQVTAYNEGTVRLSETAKNQDKTPSRIIWEKCVNDTDNKAKNIKKMRGVVESIQSELSNASEVIRNERDYLFQRKPEFEEIAEKSERNESNAGRGNFENELGKIQLDSGDLKEITEFMSVYYDEYGVKDMNEAGILEHLLDKYGKTLDQVDSAAVALSEVLNLVISTSRDAVAKTLMLNELPNENDKEKDVDINNAVRAYLYYFYANFDDLSDQISLPIFYETPVGEAVPIEVLRISPRDATGLIDENDPAIKKKKLAGTQFFNFGAFFDQVWRKNDIMWGRLDGAERIITALLPDEKLKSARDYFIKEAHEIILREDLLTSKDTALKSIFGEYLLKSSAGIDLKSAAGSITAKLSSEALNKRLSDVLGSCIEDQNVYDYVKDDYEIDRRLEPKPMLQVISRSTKVTGDILDDVAKSKNFSGNHLLWIARLGQIFWGLVEVAAPNSFWNLLFHNWLNLIYFFEVILIVTSTFLVNDEIQKFGVIGLVFTILTHMTVITLTDVMKGGKNLKWVTYLGVGAMIALAFSGLTFLISFLFYDNFWGRIVKWQANWTGISGSDRMLAAFLPTILVLYLIWQKSDKPEKPEIKKVAALFLAVFLAVGLTMNWFTSKAKTEQYPRPLISLEFADDPNEIPKIAGDKDSPVRSGIKRALAIDSYLFVPIYAGFLFYLAQFFGVRREKWSFYLGIIISILVFIAAIADLTENYFTYSMLDSVLDKNTFWILDAVRYSAIAKWSSVFASILSIIFGGLYYWLSEKNKSDV